MTAAAAETRSKGLLYWLKKEALPLLVMLGLLAAARETALPTTTRCPAAPCSTP